MALPQVSDKPATPKRVAAYLINTMISHGLGVEIDALAAAHDVTLSSRQRSDIIVQHEKFAERVRKMIEKV